MQHEYFIQHTFSKNSCCYGPSTYLLGYVERSIWLLLIDNLFLRIKGLQIKIGVDQVSFLNNTLFSSHT